MTTTNLFKQKAGLETKIKDLTAELKKQDTKFTAETDAVIKNRIYELRVELRLQINQLQEDIKSLNKIKSPTSSAPLEITDDQVKKMIAFVEEHDIYWTSSDNSYLRYVPELRQWVWNTRDALSTMYPELKERDTWDNFQEALGSMGRKREVCTNTFGEVSDKAVNLLKKGEWVQPNLEGFKASKNAKAWDYMVRGSFGDDPDAWKHIKQVVGWKFMNPHETKMPVLGIYGEGGSGKNLFAEAILKRIFNGNWVKLNFGNVERFNETLIGNAVVHIDDNATKEDVSWLKAYTHTDTVMIEPKGSKAFNSAVTWMIVVTANPRPFNVEKNGSARRFSLIKCDVNLVTVVARGEGWIGPDDIIAENDDTHKETYQRARELIFKEYDPLWKSNEEIACFLGECINEAKKLEIVPGPLHGRDFKKAIKEQEGPLEEVCEEVLLDPKFDHIALPVLAELVEERRRITNPSASPMGHRTMIARVIEYLSFDGHTKKVGLTDQRIETGSIGNRSRQRVFFSIPKYTSFGPTIIEPNKQTDSSYRDKTPMSEKHSEVHKAAMSALEKAKVNSLSKLSNI